MRIALSVNELQFAGVARELSASARIRSVFAAVLVLVLLLAGRAAVSAPAVPAGDAKADARVAELLAMPLSADAAVEVAFLRSAAVQAALAGLYIVEGDDAQKRAPTRVAPGAWLPVEPQLLENDLTLMTAGSRFSIAEAEAERKRLLVALDVATIRDQVRRTWIEAVAARERLAVIETIFESSRIAAQMSERLVTAGNSAPLDQMRVQALMAETAAVLARSKLAQQLSRERLLRVMGIWGREANVILPDRLSDLPAANMPAGDIERLAVRRRFDLAAARIEVEVLATHLGIVEPTSLVTTAETKAPPDDAQNDKARWTYYQAVQRLRAKAVAARSEVREAWINLNGLRDIAWHYAHNVAPLRQRISEQELLRYNGMLVGVFELITTARQASEATLAVIDSKRDYWIAKEQLDFVMRAGGGVAASASGGEAMPADDGGGAH